MHVTLWISGWAHLKIHSALNFLFFCWTQSARLKTVYFSLSLYRETVCTAVIELLSVFVHSSHLPLQIPPNTCKHTANSQQPTAFLKSPASRVIVPSSYLYTYCPTRLNKTIFLCHGLVKSVALPRLHSFDHKTILFYIHQSLLKEGQANNSVTDLNERAELISFI